MFGFTPDFELSVLIENGPGLSVGYLALSRLPAFCAIVLIALIGLPRSVVAQQSPFLDTSGSLMLFEPGEAPPGWLISTQTSDLPPPQNPADLPPAPLTPPQNAGPAKDAFEATAPLLDDSAGTDDIVPEPKKEEKKEEKPAIPDLAKGILIQQNDGDLTFVPGMRIQPRYNYDENFQENDFFINRFRLKGAGSMYGLGKYYVELQLDGTSRFQTQAIAQDQNAWMDFIFEEELLYFRVGLFDVPFSRDALTSDSKLLIMDRSLIRGDLAALGLADDTVGFMFHGRPHKGHLEYAVGLFDDFAFEKRDPLFPRETDQLMPAFRVGAALLDPYPALDGYADYKASYLGQSTRLDLGFNAAHLGEVFDGPVVLDLTAVGGDLFFAKGHYTFQAEYDFYVENIAFAGDFTGHGWYAQGGYLFNVCDPCLEFAVRYQTLDSDLQPDEFRWTSIGFNWYIRDHNLKIQTDYTFRNGGPLDPNGRILDENVYALQFQLDF
jgi:hypothetical protein